MYLNLVQIAESFGVSENTVDGWIRNDGMPATPDRDRLLFDRAQVAQWAAKRGLATRVGFLSPEASGYSQRLKLGPLLRAGHIWRDVSASDVPAIFERILNELPGATLPVRQLLGQRLKAKDGVTIAPVGGGFALPHPSARITLGHDSGIVALLLLRDDLKLEEPPQDNIPVRKLFFFISPSPRGHFDILANLSRGLVKGHLKELVNNNAPDEELFHAMDAMDEIMEKKQ